MDLIWTGHEIVVAGPDTRMTWSATPSGHVDTGVRFAPGVGPTVLGVCASELRDRRVLLVDMWSNAQVRQLTEQLAESPRPAVVLERLVADQMRDSRRPNPLVAAIADDLRAGTPVAAVSQAVGVSQRQLHRICLAAFGYGAKTLGRILRMDRAVVLARRGVRFAEVAARTGYADQAHLAREVKTLAGVPLGQLVRSQVTQPGLAASGHSR